jgi:hypothetical protein
MLFADMGTVKYVIAIKTNYTHKKFQEKPVAAVTPLQKRI